MRTIPVPVVPRPLRWAAVALVGGVIFYASIISMAPQTDIEKWILADLIDKWRHFLAYGALAGSLWYATLEWKQPRRYIVLFVLGITIAYGIGIEFWQALVPTRYFSSLDVVANILGSLFVIPLFALRERMDLVRLPNPD